MCDGCMAAVTYIPLLFHCIPARELKEKSLFGILDVYETHRSRCRVDCLDELICGPVMALYIG